MPAELRRDIVDGAVGVVVLFKRNLVIERDDIGERVHIARLEALLQSLHAARGDNAASPLLVAVDQEGGRVQRLREPCTRWPAMLQFDSIAPGRASVLAREVGLAMGRELAAVGFDIDFAPVLDVHTNAANPIIGDRAFSRDPARAAELALAFADGLAAAGIISCGKHFPGHGDTSLDSHLQLPRIDHDMARLEAVELAPFRRAAREKIPMLMTAHIVFGAVDPELPATLSTRVITDLLRGEIGYEGVVVSDDLDMKAIADNYGAGEAAVMAVAAGCDALLLCCEREPQRQAREALIRAAEQRSALRNRVFESAARVRDLKVAHLMNRRGIREAPGSATPQGDRIACESHRQLAHELAAVSAGDRLEL